MSNKNKNEELQSRREFFKKAAKAALPVVGAVVLSSLPFAKVDASQTSQFCEWCANGCSSSCSRNCQTLCALECSNDCKNQCRNSCYGTCKGGCARQAYA